MREDELDGIKGQRVGSVGMKNEGNDGAGEAGGFAGCAVAGGIYVGKESGWLEVNWPGLGLNDGAGQYDSFQSFQSFNFFNCRTGRKNAFSPCCLAAKLNLFESIR